MSLLVVGLSHRTAPVSLLERAAVGADELPDDAGRAAARRPRQRGRWCCPPATGSRSTRRSTGSTAACRTPPPCWPTGSAWTCRPSASTCTCTTRTRPCCTCSRWRPGSTRWWSASRRSSASCATAYAAAAELDAVSRELHELCQQALRVGKRVHAETGIDRAGASVVSVGLAEAERRARPAAPGKRALVIGAGSMGALSAATLARAGIGELVDRQPVPASGPSGWPRSSAGRPARCRWTAVPAELAGADLVVGCTGAVGTVLAAATVEAALPARGRPAAGAARPRAAAGRRRRRRRRCPACTTWTWPRCRSRPSGSARTGTWSGPGRSSAEEVAGRLGARRATAVAPTVTALRARAAEVVDAELARLDSRLPGLDATARAEVARTVHRVVQTLLHAPTVRVKQLAERPGGDAYADALRELFDLDPAATAAVAAAVLPHRGRASAMTAPLRIGTRGSALARSQTAHGHRRAGQPRDQGRGGRDRHRRRPVDRRADPDRRHRGVRLGAARRAARPARSTSRCTRTRTCRRRRQPGLVIAAVPPREDPRDVLVARDGLTLAELPVGAVVGTGAPRRAAQIRALGLGVEVVPIRGNVDTRLRKVSAGEVDAVVLARAGLARLDRLDEVTETLDPLLMLPAPAQGALAVECRASDGELVAQLAALDHADSRAAVLAERALLAAPGGGLHRPGRRPRRGRRGRARSGTVPPRLGDRGRRLRRRPAVGHRPGHRRRRRSAGGWPPTCSPTAPRISLGARDEPRAQDHRSGHLRRGWSRRPRPAHRPGRRGAALGGADPARPGRAGRGGLPGRGRGRGQTGDR